MSKETQKQAREYLINYLKKLEITNMTNFKILPQLLTDFAIQENKEKDKEHEDIHLSNSHQIGEQVIEIKDLKAELKECREGIRKHIISGDTKEQLFKLLKDKTEEG